jgi:hypothetical protein
LARLHGLAFPLVATSIQLAAAALAIGRPDLGSALAFLGGEVTAAGGLAASELLVWMVVLAMLGWSVGMVVREVRRRPAVALGLQQSWELAVLITGLVVLVAGGAHHLAGSAVQLGGGSIQEARSLAGG